MGNGRGQVEGMRTGFNTKVKEIVSGFSRKLYLESERIENEKMECESIVSKAKTELAIALSAPEEALAK